MNSEFCAITKRNVTNLVKLMTLKHPERRPPIEIVTEALSKISRRYAESNLQIVFEDWYQRIFTPRRTTCPASEKIKSNVLEVINGNLDFHKSWSRAILNRYLDIFCLTTCTLLSTSGMNKVYRSQRLQTLHRNFYFVGKPHKSHTEIWSKNINRILVPNLC